MGQFLQLWNLEFIQAGPSRSADSAQFNFNSELLETTFFLYLTLASEMIIRAKSLHRNRNPQNAAKCGVFFFYVCLPKIKTWQEVVSIEVSLQGTLSINPLVVVITSPFLE